MTSSQGLYDPIHEHDACGVGFVANIDGRQSHEIVARGIEILNNLLHRGATGGDNKTGDGAGLLIQIPDAFMRRVASESGMTLPEAGRYGVGMLFLPQDPAARQHCQELVETVAAEEGLNFLGWREVPVDNRSLGKIAQDAQPFICQCFLGHESLADAALERKLYVARKVMEHRLSETFPADDCYIASLSSRTIVYKGMMMGTQVAEFYGELKDPELISAVAVIHQRYSTNTFPSWKLAQPFRYLAHNGEINTVRGNRIHMKSRERDLASKLFGDDIKKILPVLDETGSDSASLDNAFELLTAAGRDMAHAMMMLVPQAWGVKYPIGPDLRGFFEYHSGLMEPWDGPAALAFTNGAQVGALLDRNGLRPARYTITKGGFMVLSSETGVLEIAPEDVAETGALRPGQMLLVDFARKRVLKDGEIKTDYARRQPYRRWVDENKITLRGLFSDVAPVVPDHSDLIFRQKLFGYTREDQDILLSGMASTAHEPTGSMGNDTPLAVLREKPQVLYNYFRQMFAQVTNPAIDPIREELVMSLMTFIGNPGNILEEVPAHAQLIKLLHPIISNEDLKRIRNLKKGNFRSETLPIGFTPGYGEAGLEQALRDLCRKVDLAVAEGARLFILSDRELLAEQVPIPSLLAVSTVNQHLIKKNIRTGSAILLETGEAREVMHLALLLGYGATAVNPYLAFETVADLAERGLLEKDLPVAQAIENYITALRKGLLKIMSKMGISTLRSYRSAQVFEAIGLNHELVDRFFPGTSSKIEGIGLAEIASEAQTRYEIAHTDLPGMAKLLPSGGLYRFRRDGERHLWTPASIAKLQQSTKTANYALYKEYAALINDQSRQQSTLRGLFRFRPGQPVPIEEVEPVENIVKRFVTGAMSFGSISREAHESLAIAMNRLGGMSNSGEGGEDPARFIPFPNGDSRCSAIKQVASGRFGVTTEYLTSGREIQIKIAQGAKPGEGGQLPGHKVNAEIAKVRHSTPGVTLISPPPHHDIYSIEDIKQLIFDLKNVNPKARVSVKLVSESGVGTIAAGVAKGDADMILISGHDGGTGASPLSSVYHVGAPWELGLAETQQTLVLNNLRGKIRLQTDGQLKTGRDVAIAALLGAEEFGFATAPLVVCGCVMMRCCHKNTCPVGIATQDAELRKRYNGSPDYLVNFFRMLAQEVREIMAELGFRSISEMIGRADCLETNEAIEFWKARGLNFDGVFARIPGDNACQKSGGQWSAPLEKVLDETLIELSQPALEKGEKVIIERKVRSVDRTVGAMLSGEIARRYGNAGLPDDTITCRFNGSIGQSFAAFATKGLTMILEGEANDYVAKGLSGAKIVVKPSPLSTFEPADNIICGNVLLYGATSGEVFIHGQAGERFAIRNSGANVVVEGVGDHACEYMTGGRVVILGETGLNFGAGMSGGIAYVYDPDRKFDARCNLDMVDLEMVTEPGDQAELKTLIEKHLAETGSARAANILAAWEEALPSFVKVFPMEYRRVLGQMSKEDEATEREEVVNG
jgi:glutamate synthase (NADPH/NADH) large chain